MAQLGSTTTRSPSPAVTSSESTSSEGMLAFSRCVRAHGVPDFPDPDGSGHLPPGGKEIAQSSPGFAAAQNACAHLLSSGAGTAQQRGQKFAFALTVARCLRRHGFPAFPDPTASGQAVPPGIDPRSPRFHAAQSACQKQAQKELGLP